MINDVTGLMLNHYERSAVCRRIISVSQKKYFIPKSIIPLQAPYPLLTTVKIILF